MLREFTAQNKPSPRHVSMENMNSKTRFLKALKHDKPDRPAFNFWMDRPVMAEYEERIGHRHWRVTHFGADVIETFPHIVFGLGKPPEDGGYAVSATPTLDWDKADELKMPDPHQSAVYECIKADLDEFPDHAVILDMTTPWGHITGMRTYERVYMDMYDHPEAFHRLLRRITDVLKVVTERACDMGITALYLMEDLADRNGLSISPGMIEEFCLPSSKELADIAISRGVPVLFHSDGKVTDLIELLLKIGVCAVNPLQPHLNDAAEFKQRFGDRMAVYGGLDNCYIIPNEPAEKVREHVLDVFEKLGKPDGALVFSTHDIPAGTPEENLETVIMTIKEECIY